MRISDWSSDVCSSDLGYPACSIAGDAAARYDHVDVGMMGKRGSPCMEYGGDADPGTEMLGISGDREHRIGRGLEQQIIAQRFVMIRSEEHTSELQSLMRISYAVFCLKKKT